MAQRFVITADHADGIYRAGDTVHWRVQWEGPAAAPASITYIVKKGGRTEVDHGGATLMDGATTVDSKFEGPGTLLLEVRAEGDTSRRNRGLGGAVASPARVGASSARPADFDAFWAEKLKELAAVPANPRLEPGDAGKPNVTYSKITMDNIRGTHIQGQLARPAEGTKFPALLIVQWAGVYGLQKGWATDRAAEGWLTLNIEAHDIPIDQPASFYTEQSNGPLRNYPAIGNDDRETSYFLRMYLSCYRAAQYLTERPDWDGKTLVVMGGSQGGQQTLVTAGLHSKITAALADVPAGCDMLGPNVGRQPGWPQWYDQVGGKDPAKVRETSRYFDAVNFAPRIKCPILIGAGLIDETCPPEGILAAANQIKAPKEILLYPKGGHQDENGTHGAYTKRCWSAWLPALLHAKPAPVQ
jgi:cephalosporin-C deacetylase-like acetyl esterase